MASPAATDSHSSRRPSLDPGRSPATPRAAHKNVPDLSPGAVIQHYELIRKLGSGGMGLVFLARDIRLGRLVAIKFLLVETGVALERFVIEARTTASCRHENIVIIYDVGEVAGFPYLVLEYVEGRTLREFMQEVLPNRASMAIELILPVARALAYAHAMGIIHRDLKPENILLSDSGQIKVVDFGIAKQVAEVIPGKNLATPSLNTRSHLTEDGALLGTTDYMAPEQWLGEAVDARVDIWGIGMVLFELATGVHPQELFIADESGDVSMVEVPMPSARQELPQYPELAEVIDECLRKRVDERLGSAQELVEALERLQREENHERAIEEESPFAGLSAFQESDAAHFFGRDDEIAAVIARFRQEPLVAIAGPSGAGKSSFVRAGVIPTLKRAYRDMEVFVVRPGRQPIATLTELLVSLVEAADRDSIAEMMRAQPGYFGATLRARCKQRGNNQHIVLFVDQFEELYTQGTDAGERDTFCACLAGAADDASSPLRVLLAIRSDFLDRMAEARRWFSALHRGLWFLPPMTNEGLRQAIEKPIESAGYRFEDEKLVDDILEGVAGTKSPLPLLQFMAAKSWETRNRQQRMLTRKAYKDLGGVTGALSMHADAVLAAMTSSEQRLVRSIFLRLVTPEKTRAVLLWDELLALSENGSMVEQVVQHLANARLLLIEAGREHSGRSVELTHESLIERWATLRQWLHANEDDVQFLAELRGAAAQWENRGKTADFLWRDRAAAQAKEWLAHYRENRGNEESVELGAREIEYLDAVVRLANRAKRKRKQVVSGMMALLCAVVFVVSLLGLQAHSEAKRADTKAVEAVKSAEDAWKSAADARNATRMAAAGAHVADPTLALALMREMDASASLPPKWNELAQRMLHHDLSRVVLTHESPVQHAAFSPDGNRIVTASWDRSVRVWNSDGRGEPQRLEGHEDQVQSAAFSPNGQSIVTGSSDKTARIWNADGSGKPIVLQGHQGPVVFAAFSADGQWIVTASSDKTARIWKVDGTDKPIVLAGHEAEVTSAAFSPDGSRIVTSSRDHTVRVWNADGRGESIVLRGHSDQVFFAAFSPDGRRIVSASFDSTARVWNAKGGGTPIVFVGHDNPVHSAVFSPDGRRIATASWDHTVRIWNADSSGVPVLLAGHQDKVNAVAFSPDGNQVVSASLDRTVRVWDVASIDKPLRLGGHEGTIISATFSPDGKRLATASFDKTARIWKVDASEPPLVLRGHEDKLMSASFSPDGNQVATTSQDKTIRIWDAHTGQEKFVLGDHLEAPLSAAFSPDGRRLVTASWDRMVRVWTMDGQSEPLVLQGHQDVINSTGFGPDGLRIISASDDKTARIWNANGSGQARILRGHTAGVYSAAFSPDGRYALTASWDKTVRLWNLDGDHEPLVFQHNAAVGAGSIGGIGTFSPDGARFVTIADDKTLHIWNANGSGDPIVVHFPELYPTIAAFSPDGTRIVTASHEQKDPATGVTRYWATVWPAFKPLNGPADSQLWRATTYCPSVALRHELLGVSEKLAREQYDRCRTRVVMALEDKSKP